MINVCVARVRETDLIAGFMADGHALFAESGQDIVCAGVSAVTVGTVNAAEAVVGVELAVEMNSGKLHARVPKGLSPSQQSSLQLLLESMIVMLRTIEESYGEHIRVQEQYE